MNGPTLQVQMLGQFTLRYGDRTISDSDDRSRRVWSLLAYMLYNHGRSFAQEELIHLYWSNGEKSADPGNALKSIFHRIRTALDKLQPGLGRLLIRRKVAQPCQIIFPVAHDSSRLPIFQNVRLCIIRFRRPFVNPSGGSRQKQIRFVTFQADFSAGFPEK